LRAARRAASACSRIVVTRELSISLGVTPSLSLAPRACLADWRAGAHSTPAPPTPGASGGTPSCPPAALDAGGADGDPAEAFAGSHGAGCGFSYSGGGKPGGRRGVAEQAQNRGTEARKSTRASFTEPHLHSVVLGAAAALERSVRRPESAPARTQSPCPVVPLHGAR
jgi:hypothetical protein